MNELWKNTFDYWQSGGILLLPIAIISAGIWGCFFSSRNTLQRALQEGRLVEMDLEKLTPDKNLAKVSDGWRHLNGGVAEMMRNVIASPGKNGTCPLKIFAVYEEECLRQLHRDFILLAAFTAVAPLLGLLGTVAGMIETFDAVATVSGNTGSRVADGISQALITTQFGLVVALPGVFGLARLQRMHRNVEVMLATCRAHLQAVLNRAELQRL